MFKSPFFETSGPHLDFDKNLQKANRFIENSKKSWNFGINVCIRGFVLWIEFIPGKTSKMHNTFCPLTLHQSEYEFEKEMVFQFNILNFKAKPRDLQMNF